jgi:hypothetical protein
MITLENLLFVLEALTASQLYIHTSKEQHENKHQIIYKWYTGETQQKHAKKKN